MTKQSITLKNIVLLSLSIFLFACGKEERPHSAKTSETKISLTIDGKPVDTTKDLTTTDEHSEHIAGNRIELSGPFIDITFPESMQGKEVTAEVKKLNHLNDLTCGITSVCLENCFRLEDIKQNYSSSFKVEAKRVYSVNVHYGIALNGQDTPTPSMLTSYGTLRAGSTEPYRVELTIKHGSEELLKLTFAYSPKNSHKKEETLITPPPAPTPMPNKPESAPAEPAPPVPAPPAAPTPTPPVVPAQTEQTEQTEPPAPIPSEVPAPAPPTASTPIQPTPAEPAAPAPAQPTPDPMPTESQQGNRPYPSNVVVLDITGQNCPNCPSKMEKLLEYKKEMKDNLVVVAIHTWSNDFENEESRFYDSRGYLPILKINNRHRDKNEKWVYESFAKKAPLVKSILTAKLTDNNKNVEVVFRSDGANGQSTIDGHPKVNLLLWVLENDLKAYQATRGDYYNHQHVFRAILHNRQGNPIASYAWGESYALGTTVKRSYSLPKNIKNIKNCEVVAIVLDADTHEFLDGVTFKFKESSHN